MSPMTTFGLPGCRPNHSQREGSVRKLNGCAFNNIIVWVIGEKLGTTFYEHFAKCS